MGLSCPTDFDQCDVWNEETRRARKPHKCCECGGMTRKTAYDEWKRKVSI